MSYSILAKFKQCWSQNLDWLILDSKQTNSENRTKGFCSDVGEARVLLRMPATYSEFDR